MATAFRAATPREECARRELEERWDRSRRAMQRISRKTKLPHGLPLVRVIAMPADANPNGDIFGGWLLSQMDLAGGSLAAQRARGRCATVAVDGMVFHEPVFVGDEVSCYGELVKTGRTSMTIRIEAWRRHLPSDEVRQMTQAIFTYVAIGENRRPRPLPAIPYPARSATDPCS